MLMGDSNSQTLGFKQSALTIVLNSLKASAGKELSLSRWCVVSLYNYHFLQYLSLTSHTRSTLFLLDKVLLVLAEKIQ